MDRILTKIFGAQRYSPSDSDEGSDGEDLRDGLLRRLFESDDESSWQTTSDTPSDDLDGSGGSELEDAELEASQELSPSEYDWRVDDEESAAEWVKLVVKQYKSVKLDNVLAGLEIDLGRSLTNMENALLERLYVRAKLDCWVERSLRKAKHDVAKLEAREHFVDWLSSVTDELKEVANLETLMSHTSHSPGPSSWCSGPQLDSILAQKLLFGRLGTAVESLDSTLRRFKSECTGLLLAAKLNAEGKIESEIELVRTLTDLLEALNHHKSRSKLLGRYTKKLDNPETMARVLLESCKYRPELPWNELYEALAPLPREWTLRMKRMASETFRQLLSPFGISEEVLESEGRKILQLSAVSLVWSEVKDRVEQVILNDGFQELHLMAYAALHVDDDLSSALWHGTNIAIVTEALYVDPADDRVIVWDVSGLPGPEHAASNARNGTAKGQDGQSGEHGLPGESGGNVYVMCNRLFNGVKWTIRSIGGPGGGGQSGGDGREGRNGADAKPKLSKLEFDEKFPSAGKWVGYKAGGNAIQIKSSALGMMSEGSHLHNGKSFFIDGTTSDGGGITASFHSQWSRRQVIVLIKGGKGKSGQRGGKGGYGGDGGEGGYHGEVLVKNFDGKSLTIHSSSTRSALVNGNEQAASGAKGADGTGGRHGKHGKPAGDVGFVDKVGIATNWGFDPVYRGFDDDYVYEIKYCGKTPPANAPHARCDLYRGEECHAYLVFAGTPVIYNQQSTQQEKTAVGRKQKYKTEAIRKKVITHSCLYDYADQVTERNQQLALVRQTVAHASEKQSVPNQVFTLHQQTTRCVVQKTQDESTSYVQTKVSKHWNGDRQLFISGKKSRFETAPAEGLYRDGYGSTEICPQCDPLELDETDLHALINALPSKEFTPESDAMARCLRPQRTLNDDDNIYHCLFGQGDANGCFRCPDAQKRVDYFVSFVKTNTYNPVLRRALEEFINVVGERNGGPTQTEEYPVARQVYADYLTTTVETERRQELTINELGREISSNPANSMLKSELDKMIKADIGIANPTDADRVSSLIEVVPDPQSDRWNQAATLPVHMASLITPAIKEMVARLRDPLETFWKNAVQKTKLREEYSGLIASRKQSMSDEDVELLALAYKIKVNVYILTMENVDKQSFRYSQKVRFYTQLNPNGDDDYYVLKKPDGTWEKLVRDSVCFEYLKQKAHDIDVSRAMYQQKLNGIYGSRPNPEQNSATGTEAVSTLSYESSHEKRVQIAPSSFNPTTPLNFGLGNNGTVFFPEFFKLYRILQADQNIVLLEISQVPANPANDERKRKRTRREGFEKLTSLLTNASEPPFSHRLAKLLDPEFGLPDVLSRLIWRHMHEKRNYAPSTGFVHVIQEAIDRKVRDEDSSSLLIVVSQTCPHHWRMEFVLSDIEDGLRCVLQPEERMLYTNYLSRLGDPLLNSLRSAIRRSAFREGEVFPSKEIITETLRLLSLHLVLTESDVELLTELSTGDWIYELKTKFWQKAVYENFSGTFVTDDEFQEAVYIFLELENKRGHDACLRLAEEVKKKTSLPLAALQQSLSSEDLECEAISEKKERTFYQIITTMQSDSNTSDALRSKMDKIKGIVQESRDKPHLVSGSKSSSSVTERDIRQWVFEIKENDSRYNLTEFLSVFDAAVKLLMGFNLRDTQRVTIAALLTEGKNTLAQVSTGEGKSLIIAGIAIGRALSGRTVDIVTSNQVLAIRDSHSTTEKGGLCNLYKLFGIGVANNCSQKEEDRIRAYDKPVVYGELSAFQRDHLLHSFYKRNIRGDRSFACVIVDEVDCMLLDRGNNMLYLSHDIPGMELLESLYVFLWQKVKTSLPLDLDKIKADVFYDLFGNVSKCDLKSLLPEDQQDAHLDRLWRHLINAKVIDASGRLLISEANQITAEVINFMQHPRLTQRVVYLLRNIVERQRKIQLPSQLLPFVERHLDTWLNNAVRALILSADEHYVVDQDRSGTNPDLNPLVTIIDPDTGTDHSTSQWDGALHQFLQLKEGCQLTLQSLKAVFVSNVSFFKRYSHITGLTGTLGSEPERHFLKTMYDSHFMTVPTAYPKMFTYRRNKVFDNEENWLEAIVDDVRTAVVKEQRSVLLFCQSIRDVHQVRNHLLATLKSTQVQFHCYTRDYEEFTFESNELDPGHVIIATNLAGRGTDIKISETLRSNGGLHVCLTYLPDNVRVEEQATGRAGRKGAPGSSTLILCFSTEENRNCCRNLQWSDHKIFKIKQERNRHELHRISRLRAEYLSNINIEEQCFARFAEHYDRLKRDCNRLGCDEIEQDVFCLSALDEWALWLDSVGVQESSFSNTVTPSDDMLRRMEREWVGRLELRENNWCPDWVTPSRRITLAKHWATGNGNNKIIDCGKRLNNLLSVLPNLSKPWQKRTHEEKRSAALKLLNHLTENNIDSFCYPAAHYYKAFALLKEADFGKNKDEIFKTLWKAEEKITEHIQNHTEYSLVISQLAKQVKQVDSFCDVEAYKKQKDNVVYLLQQYLDSISAILGRHFTRDTLQQFSVDADVFQKLVKNNYVTLCRKTPRSRLPDDQSVVTKRIAHSYGIEENLLKKFMEDIPGPYERGIEEKEVASRAKKNNLFAKTRKSFWNLMVEGGVLVNACNCLIIHKSIWQGLSIPEETKTRTHQNAELFLNEPDSPLVVYNQTFRCFEDLRRNGMMLMDKSCAKRELGPHYKRHKSCFESNKYALKIDRNKLEAINLSFIDGYLNQENFKFTSIPKSEWPGIWKALVDQAIIYSCCGPCEIEKEFTYPDCPCYEDEIEHLIRQTFSAELVRRSWLRATDQAVKTDERLGLNTIDSLPLKPHRDLLSDLLSAHLITLPLVSDDPKIDLNRDGGLVDTVIHLGKPQLNEIFPSEVQRQAVLSSLRSARATYACLETPDATLEEIHNAVQKAGGPPVPQELRRSLTSDLNVFNLIGFDHLIVMQEQTYSFKMIVRATVVILVGVAQVAIGALILMKTAGIMTHVGQGFISEGVSDILYAMSALISGRNFTWTDYGRHKATSIAITAATAGIACAFSRGVKFFKYGYKTAGPQLVGKGGKLASQSASAMGLSAKAIAKEVAKTTVRKIGEGVALGLVGHGVQTLVREQVGAFCRGVAKQLLEDLHQMLATELLDLQNELAVLHNKLGPAKAKQIFESAMRRIVVGESSLWMRECVQWVTNLTGAIASGLAMAAQKRKAADMASVTVSFVSSAIEAVKNILEGMKMGVQMINITVGHIANFYSEIRTSQCREEKSANISASPQPSAKNKQARQFGEWAADHLKSTVQQQAAQLLDGWINRTLDNTAKSAVVNVARYSKKLYRSYKESCYVEQFEALQKEEALRRQKERQGKESSEPGRVPTKEHVEACLKLAKKTRNPKLFADIIREGVPTDRFCAEALAAILPGVLRSIGIDTGGDIRIKIQSTDDSFSHTTGAPKTDANELTKTLVINLDRALPGETTGHFNGGESSKGYNCMFESLIAQIREHLPPGFDSSKLNADYLREKAANMVESDPLVSHSIRQGWHEFTHEVGFYGGGTGETGKCGLYRESRKKYSLKGVAEQDHQPATAHWKFAKDKGVAEIKSLDHPVISIPSEWHKETLNFRFKARQNSLFTLIQKDFMRKGDYMGAIWHALKANTIDLVIRNVKDESVKDDYFDAISRHIDIYSTMKFTESGGKSRTIITAAECIELKNRLKNSFNRF